MEKVFTVGPGSYNNDIGFFAKTVKVQSGLNYVILQPNGYIIGPGVVGWVAPLPLATQIASFDIQASPLGVGATPLGPQQQAQAIITYSDQDLPPSPGVLLQPQAVSVIQTGSQIVGPNNQVNIVPALARAFTLFAITDDQSLRNWSLFGQMGVGGLSPTVLSATNVNTFQYAVGQGTSYIGILPSVSFAATQHMFPEFALICTASFFFDLRFYF